MRLSKVRSSFLLLKVRFSLRRFSRNSKNLITVQGHLYRISSKHEEKLKKIWQNFSYAFEVSKAFTVLIFTKIPSVKKHYVENYVGARTSNK